MHPLHRRIHSTPFRPNDSSSEFRPQPATVQHRPISLLKACLQRAVALAFAALLASAVYRSVTLAIADSLARQPSADRVAAALRLAPENANYWQRFADLADEEGHPVPDAYQRAATLNPYDASSWIRAGLHAEAVRDFSLAERNLLQAAHVSRLYEPRWTLANFYFRRGDAPHFWPWAKSALTWAYDDRRPLFDLCWNMSSDPAVLLRTAIPDTPEVRADYLAYLLDRDRLDAAQTVAAGVAETAGPDHRELLLRHVNRMLETHRWDSALDVWNALCRRHVLPYEALDPSAGRSLTNPDFRWNLLTTGFDWQLASVPGVTSLQIPAPPALRFSLSGKQPEQCDMLQQWLPVLPHDRYRLAFDYRTSTIAPNTGLQWTLWNGVTGSAIPSSSPQLSSTEWLTAAVDFTAPPDAPILRLVLAYKRAPGTVRINGEVWLRNLRLEFL